MKLIGITNPGLEDVAALEIKEICGCKAQTLTGAVVFDAKEDCVPELLYKSQSLSRVMAYLMTADFSSFDDLNEKAGKIEVADWAKKAKTFKVATKRHGDHEFTSDMVNRSIGGAIAKKIKLEVDLSKPELIVFINILGKNVYIGVDLVGFSMAKRPYKIFQTPASLKGTVGYGLCRLSGFQDKGNFLDPFCGDGVVAIEAALFAAGIGPHHFRHDPYQFEKLSRFDGWKKKMDEMRKVVAEKIIAKITGYDPSSHYLSSAKKNAKIAAVNKITNFSRVETEWLDTKFEEKSVSFIATQLPMGSKNVKEEKTKKVYREFFYQADFVLKPGAKMAVTSNRPEFVEEYAKEYKFEMAEHRKVWQGMAELDVFVLLKK